MNKRTRMLTISAILAALVAVLGIFSVRLANFKLTFEGIPIYVGALLLGPSVGCSVAFIGTLISQFILYGLSPTTPMWMLPPIVVGLIAGLYAKKHDYQLTRKRNIIILVFCSLVRTTLNTIFLYLDAKFYGYYTPSLIWGMLVPRYIIAVVQGIAYALIIPELVDRLREALKIDGSWARS